MGPIPRVWVMEIALLLLTLLPLAFLPEFGGGEDEGAEGSSEETDTDLQPLTPWIGDDTVDPNQTDPEGVILSPEEDTPDNPDQQPVDGEPLRPADSIEGVNGKLQLDFEDVTATGYVEVFDFDPGQDNLEILIESQSVQGGADLLIMQSPDGQDAEVYVEGQLVAVLKGAPQADASDVLVTVTA